MLITCKIGGKISKRVNLLAQHSVFLRVFKNKRVSLYTERLSGRGQQTDGDHSLEGEGLEWQEKTWGGGVNARVCISCNCC